MQARKNKEGEMGIKDTNNRQQEDRKVETG